MTGLFCMACREHWLWPKKANKKANFTVRFFVLKAIFHAFSRSKRLSGNDFTGVGATYRFHRITISHDKLIAFFNQTFF